MLYFDIKKMQSKALKESFINSPPTPENKTNHNTSKNDTETNKYKIPFLIPLGLINNSNRIKSVKCLTNRNEDNFNDLVNPLDNHTKSISHPRKRV